MRADTQKLHAVYEFAKNDPAASQTGLRLCAAVADAAFGEVNAASGRFKLNVKFDDRAEELVAEVFRFACESNGYDWRDIYAKIEAAA